MCPMRVLCPRWGLPALGRRRQLKYASRAAQSPHTTCRLASTAASYASASGRTEDDTSASAVHQRVPVSRCCSSARRLRRCIRKPLRIHSWFHCSVLLQLVVKPYFDRELIDIAVQPPASGKRNALLCEARNCAPLICGDGNAVEGDAQIIPRHLQTLVLGSVQPRQAGIAREEIRPCLQRFRDFDAELFCFFEDRRTGIGRKNIGPELSAGKAAAHVHHEADRLAAFFPAFAGKGKDDVERRANAGGKATFGALIDRLEILPVLVHGVQHSTRTRVHSLANLV